MKAIHYLLIVLTVGVLALAGCGKSNKPAPPAARVPGVVDLAQLQMAFPAPTPEISTSFSKLGFATRYRQFEPALVELDKLSRLPNLTEAQKKAVDEVIEQVKQALAVNPKP